MIFTVGSAFVLHSVNPTLNLSILYNSLRAVKISEQSLRAEPE